MDQLATFVPDRKSKFEEAANGLGGPKFNGSWWVSVITMLQVEMLCLSPR